MMLAQPGALRIVLHSPRRIATYAFQLKNRGRGSFSSDQPRTLADFESPNFTIKNDFSLESNLADRSTLKRIRDGVSRRTNAIHSSHRGHGIIIAFDYQNFFLTGSVVATWSNIRLKLIDLRVCCYRTTALPPLKFHIYLTIRFK